MKIRLLAVAGLAALLASPSFAQQAPKCEGRPDVCQKIVEIGKQYDAAANKGDAAALKALYTSDALILGAAPILAGKDGIAKFYDGNPMMGHI